MWTPSFLQQEGRSAGAGDIANAGSVDTPTKSATSKMAVRRRMEQDRLQEAFTKGNANTRVDSRSTGGNGAGTGKPEAIAQVLVNAVTGN
jgi:hypothetical protein